MGIKEDGKMKLFEKKNQNKTTAPKRLINIKNANKSLYRFDKEEFNNQVLNSVLK